MNIKKLSAAILAIILLISLCACGDKDENTTPLWELYPGERIKTLSETLPALINIRVDTADLSASIYDSGDEEMIKKISDAFLAVKAGKETEITDFRQEYSVDFIWDDEVVSVVMNSSTAAVFNDDSVKYYNISGAESFIENLRNIAAEEEKIDFNADRVIDEQNLAVDISKNSTFGENGDYVVELNVTNNRSDTVGIVLSGIKADKMEISDSAILYVKGNSELGFSVPVKLPEGKEIKKISFHIEAGIGTEEPFEAFITSSDYVIKLN